MPKAMRRTCLAMSPETQALLRMLQLLSTLLGRERHRVRLLRLVDALNDTNFTFEHAAHLVGVKPCTLRQRVHKLQRRAREFLGEAFFVPLRRRPRVRFGADDKVYRMFGADTEDPAELAAQREEEELARSS